MMKLNLQLFASGSTTGSIIAPVKPSQRTRTGFLYFMARSKAS